LDQSGVYQKAEENPWKPFVRNKGRSKNEFLHSDVFQQFLSDPGATFTHPHKASILLEDIFVYPELRDLVSSKSKSGSNIIHGKDLAEYTDKNSLIFISGSETSGKTSFAKTATVDFHRKGKVPLYIEGKSFLSSDERKVTKVLDEAVEKQYSKSLTTRHWQLDRSRRVVILDDYDKIQLGYQGKDAILERLSSLFGTVIVLGNKTVCFEELADPGDKDRILWKFKHFEILEFGYVLRSHLVRKWYSLGGDCDRSPGATQEIYVRTEKLIATLLGRDLLPSYPLFILIILQSAEIRTRVNTTSGSFGYFYESLITEALSKSSLNSIEIDTKYNYLSELAYHFYKEKCNYLRDDEIVPWHLSYCEDYSLILDYEKFRDDLDNSGLLEYSDTEGWISFRYKYIYCYFVARYIRDHLNEPDIRDRIRELSARLYHEESANIIIFLCYLPKDSLILDCVLSSANSLFEKFETCKLEDDIAFLKGIRAEMTRLQPIGSNPEENRQEQLREQDRASTHQSEESPNLDGTEGEIDSIEDETLKQWLQVNTAYKTIQILGQIFRNFSGSLRGDLKLDITQSCYSLGLRTLTLLFRMIKEGKQELVSSLTAQMEKKYPHKDRFEIENSVNELIINLSEFMTFSIVKHISDSVGLDSLSQTFREALARESSTSRRLIDLSIKLDYYKGFPEKETLDLHKYLTKDKNYFSHSVLRHLVWYRFYLYHAENRLRQSVCNQLGIPLKEALFLDQKVKKDRKR
jgi:hypothetical protein